MSDQMRLLNSYDDSASVPRQTKSNMALTESQL